MLDRGFFQELISYTCLALLRSQGVLACSLLVAAGTDVRERKEGTRERMRVFLLTLHSKNLGLKWIQTSRTALSHRTFASGPIPQHQCLKHVVSICYLLCTGLSLQHTRWAEFLPFGEFMHWSLQEKKKKELSLMVLRSRVAGGQV